jgi:ubiquinone/menaquinone biosynthesis C-methylase UbiE
MTLTKQDKERQFHNEAFATHARQGADAFYSVLRASRLFFEEQMFAGAAGGRVLEYGCGTGTYSFALAARGANVTGIDISDVAIEKASEKARLDGLDITYRRMDAEQLEFPDNSFDVVCGVAILHHLDLDKAYAGLARVLRPGGHAVFMEPLAHNPAINLYRRLTPQLRTEDEHPLRMKDLRLAHRYFQRVENRFFTLHPLLAVPFRRTAIFKPLVRTLDGADRVLFGVCPPARRLAWQVIIVLAQPRKPATI